MTARIRHGDFHPEITVCAELSSIRAGFNRYSHPL
jgi:hypothetical protein